MYLSGAAAAIKETSQLETQGKPKEHSLLSVRATMNKPEAECSMLLTALVLCKSKDQPIHAPGDASGRWPTLSIACCMQACHRQSCYSEVHIVL